MTYIFIHVHMLSIILFHLTFLLSGLIAIGIQIIDNPVWFSGVIAKMRVCLCLPSFIKNGPKMDQVQKFLKIISGNYDLE